MSDRDFVAWVLCGLFVFWIIGSRTCRFDCNHKKDEDCQQ